MRASRRRKAARGRSTGRSWNSSKHSRSNSADVPAWDTRPCGYLQLSRLFEPEALAAVNRGWPVVHVDGTHLHAVFEPTESADAILALIDAMKLTENGHG